MTDGTGGTGYHQSWWWRSYDRLAEVVDRRVRWYGLPRLLALPVLIGLRDVLRKRNLHDTTAEPATGLPPLETPAAEHPVERTWPQPRPDILRPSPREVSRALMTRRELVPAESVNALVAPWLQFMIRDWFSHGRSPREDPWEIELVPDDPWAPGPMTIPRTRPDPTRPAGATTPPTYLH